MESDEMAIIYRGALVQVKEAQQALEAGGIESQVVCPPGSSAG